MDDRALFERMHEALDGEPRPGAYERLRIALVRSPAKPQRRPVFGMRWSKMGFRLAAGLALIALAVAVAAALVATHRPPTGGVPAGSALSIAAYQKLVGTDYQAAVATWASPCDTTVHTGCQADASGALVALQQWLDDLNRSQPPARFVQMDVQLRAHLSEGITGLNALLAAGRANDSSAMNRAYLVGLDRRAWTDSIMPSILSSQQVSAAAYKDSVQAQKLYLDQCACQQLVSDNTLDCSGNQALVCLDYLGRATPAAFQAAVVGSAAPDSLSLADASLQHDLARADSALIAMNEAVLAGDQAALSAARNHFKQALAYVDSDAADIANS